MLIGRHVERGRLEQALEQARLGHGSIVLLGGEAGVGKTRLTTELAAGADAVVLRGAPAQGGAAPYGPVVAALRSYLRSHPGGLADVGPLRAQLAVLLPELGEPAAARRPADAVRGGALRARPRRRRAARAGDPRRSALVRRGDARAAVRARRAALDLAVLVIAAYRSDGLPRDHGVRRLRNDLRRTGRLDELVLRPLDAGGDGRAAGRGARRRRPSPPLARAIHERTEGLPFFVEELACALRVSGAVHGRPARARAVRRRRRAAPGHGPRRGPDQRVRALRGGARGRRGRGRRGRVVRARAGRRAVERRRAVRARRQRARPRGAVGRGRVPARATHEALYADVPWMRRRALHRSLAEALEAAGAPSREVAKHWLGARASAQAREALLRAAAQSRGRPRPPRRRRGRSAGARPVARARRRGAARRDAGALRALLAPGRGAGRGGAGVARARRVARRRGGRARGRPRAAGARGGLRAQGRPRGRLHRAPLRLRRLCRERPPGRGRGRAARDGQPAPPGRSARRGDRARAGRARPGRGGRPPRRADPRRRARGHGDREARRLRARARDRPRRPRAGARARPHRGRGRALPAAQRDALRVGRLPPRRGRARHGAAALPAEPGRRRRGRVRDVHGLRAARARRLGARGRDEPRADRRGHRRLRRRGPARLDPRLRGQARARRGACSRPGSPPPRASTTST